MLRGAFIGFGNVAANGHLPGWLAREDARIVAATDAVASRREAFLAACSDGRWFGSVDDPLAAGGLDFVDVCAPPGAHAEIVARALAAGLHVLCEKPLVTRAPDAPKLAGAAARAGRVVHTVHNWLKAPICARVTALVDEGAVGTVRSVRWATLRAKPAVAVSTPGAENWRVDPAQAGGGILIDHGWHALYCVARWAGAPRSLAARLETRRFHEFPLEDTATVTLASAAATSEIFLTWAAEERANTIAVEGERGAIRVEGDAVILTDGAGEKRWSRPPALSEGSHHPDWFGGVVDDFLAAVRGERASNIDEALFCAKAIDAAQRSSAAGGAEIEIVA